MPKRKRSRPSMRVLPIKRPRGLTRNQAKSVRRIARKTALGLSETINAVTVVENKQLFHNKTDYVGKLLATEQGLKDDNSSTSAPDAVRKGDEIILKNINVRFWMSNKDDRPNVIYKGILFWYDVTNPPSDATVYFTQTNKMLDRYNTEQISIVDTFIVKSTNNYAVDANNHEKSYLATLNKSWKVKKIKYDEGGVQPKFKDLGFALVAYDAFGTLQTDNIASYAYNCKLSFKDP